MYKIQVPLHPQRKIEQYEGKSYGIIPDSKNSIQAIEVMAVLRKIVSTTLFQRVIPKQTI